MITEINFRLRRLKKEIFFSLLFLLLFSSLAFAAAPAIFYSDLTSGPKTGGQDNKGAFVTIWGKNFGATRGSSYVAVGGGQVDNYSEWSDAKVCFQLGASAVTGNITVTTTAGISNGVPFTIRSGNIYFVDDTSPSNPGSGTYTDPWRSPASYCDALAGGVDGAICYFRAGTYSGKYTASDWYANFTLDPTYSGTSGNENAFIGYPNETANFVANISSNTEQNFRGKDISMPSYIVIAKLKLDAVSDCISFAGDGFRIVGNYCDGISVYSASGVITAKGNNIKIYGNEITGGSSGNRLDHAFYPNEGENLDFGWNYIHNNNFGEGPMISINHDNAWTNNWQFLNYHIHDNIIDTSSHPSRAMGVYETGPGSSFYFYNNVIIGAAADNTGTVFAVSANLYYYNNTLYVIGSPNGPAYDFYGVTENGHNYVPLSITLKNNIVVPSNNCPYYMRVTNATGMPTPTLDSNCWYGIGSFSSKHSGECGTNSNAVEQDPLFFDPTNSDYHLQANSPVKDKGADVSAIITKDHDGISRPQGAAFDIGAYEYALDSIAPGKVNDLASSSVTSTTVVLTWTAPGNDGYVGQAASYDIRYSTSSISDANWASATQVTGESTPSSAGTVELFTVSGLTSATPYYFALKTTDYASNTSDLSNVPSATTSASSSGGGGGGGSGGCCIATATFGTPMAKEVRILSKFRDNYLSNNKLGQVLLKFYFKASPKIAKYIEKRAWARNVVREMLKPLVWLAKRMVEK